MIKVFYRESQMETPGNTTIRELIKGLGLNPHSVLAVREGKLVSNETRLGNEDEIKLISVISGG